MSTFEATIQEALENPQPGDWWNEMLVNYHLVVAVQDEHVFVMKDTEPVDDRTYRYTGKIEKWNRERFEKECKFGYPYRNSRMKCVNIARKEMGLEPIEQST